MNIYKNISIFKNDTATGSQPTHTLMASDATYENKVNVASLWTKDGAKGKFLSGKMKDEYKSEKGTYPSYVIVQEDELNALIAKTQPTQPSNTHATGRTSPTEDHPEGISMEDIGF